MYEVEPEDFENERRERWGRPPIDKANAVELHRLRALLTTEHAENPEDVSL